MLGRADKHPRTPPERADCAAFAEQFQAHFRVLWLIAAGILGDRVMAEDVVQEAAVIAMGKLEQFEPGTNFTAWMGTIVRHVALNTARKEKRRQAVEFDDGQIGGGKGPKQSGGRGAGLRASNPGAMPRDRGVFDDRLMAALRSLGETARACLLLRTVEGMEYRDISQALGIPEGTAMSHVHRSRRQMRQRLVDAAETSVPTAKRGRNGT